MLDNTAVPSPISLVMDYERGVRQEAQSKAKAQLDRLGDKNWPVEVRSGDPATTIASLAKESRSRIVVVGLGGQGAAARFFGNKTALRLMRVADFLAESSEARQSRSWFEAPGVLSSFFPRPPRSSGLTSWSRRVSLVRSARTGRGSSMNSPAETPAAADVSRSMIRRSAHRSR